MKKLILIILSCLIFISGCSKGISQEDYNLVKSDYEKLLSDNEKLKNDNESLNNELSDLQSRYDILYDENEINKELSSNYTKLYMDTAVDTDDIVTQAWGTAAFGDNTKFARVDQDTIQYNAVIDEISQENINDFFNKLQDFTGALGLAMETENTKFTYIKVTDTSSLPIFELFIDISEGTDNSKIDIMINAIYDNLVKNAINKIY